MMDIQIHQVYFATLVKIQFLRFHRDVDHADIEDSISNDQRAVDITEIGHLDMPRYTYYRGRWILICCDTRSNGDTGIDNIYINLPVTPREMTNQSPNR